MSAPNRHRLTDAEWAVVGPAAERAREALRAVSDLIALLALHRALEPATTRLVGRELVSTPAPMSGDA